MVMLAMFQFASCDKLPEDRAVSTGFEVQISGMKLDDCWIFHDFPSKKSQFLVGLPAFSGDV